MSNARRSTLAHMNKLVAAAAVMGTVACNKCNSMPGGGYAVVDPMPVPARCPGVAGSMTASIAIVKGDAGDDLVMISLSLPTSGGATLATTASGDYSVTVSGGKVISQIKSASGVRFLVAPTAIGAFPGSMSLSLQAQCDAGPSTVEATAYFSRNDAGAYDATVSLGEF